MAEGRTAFAIADGEWYVEPEAATDFLLERESFGVRIWDPACGQGNILKAAARAGYSVFGSDIVDRRVSPDDFPFAPFDFLGDQPFKIACDGQTDLVMNPPYGRANLAAAFIRRALAIPEIGKVAVFVTGKFLFGKGRAQGLFLEHAPSRVIPIWPRPSCPPGELLRKGEIKASGGVENYCWILWDRAHDGDTVISWR